LELLPGHCDFDNDPMELLQGHCDFDNDPMELFPGHCDFDNDPLEPLPGHCDFDNDPLEPLPGHCDFDNDPLELLPGHCVPTMTRQLFYLTSLTEKPDASHAPGLILINLLIYSCVFGSSTVKVEPTPSVLFT